jgi:hypothetical protein
MAPSGERGPGGGARSPRPSAAVELSDDDEQPPLAGDTRNAGAGDRRLRVEPLDGVAAPCTYRRSRVGIRLLEALYCGPRGRLIDSNQSQSRFRHRVAVLNVDFAYVETEPA